MGYGIIAHQSSFSIRAVILTTLGFLIIQSVALFVLCGKLFNKEIQQMLYGEMEKKQRAGSKSGNWLSLVLGAVFLIFAYWLAFCLLLNRTDQSCSCSEKFLDVYLVLFV